MNRRGFTLMEWLVILFFGLIALFVVLYIVMYIIAMIQYGNAPITEVPMWAYRFLK